MFGINNKILASILIVSFYLLISANAIFPSGIFFSSGDTEQIINFKNFYYKKNGIWEFVDAGRVNNNYASNFYYYFIFFIIDLLDLPDNYLSFFLKFTYLFFSFLSFFVSLKILKLNINFNSNELILNTKDNQQSNNNKNSKKFTPITAYKPIGNLTFE